MPVSLVGSEDVLAPITEGVRKMAEVVEEGTPEWEEMAVGLFRFKMETLERIMDGRMWVLTAGVDYPRLMAWKKLRSRLYQGAHSRGGHARVKRLSDVRTSVQFVTTGPDTTAVPMGAQ